MDAATELGIEILEGGNLVVQTTLYDYAKIQDVEGRFFKNIVDRLGSLQRQIVRLRDEKANSKNPEALRNQEVTLVMDMREKARFLQLMCEGHNLKMQHMLRTQVPFLSRS